MTTTLNPPTLNPSKAPAAIRPAGSALRRLLRAPRRHRPARHRLGRPHRGTHPARRGGLVRRHGRRVRPHHPTARRAGHAAATQPRAPPVQLSRPQRPERRGPRRRPHVHLQRTRRRRGTDQQLDRAGRDARTRSTACSRAACAAARCTSSRSRWARSGPRSPSSACR